MFVSPQNPDVETLPTMGRTVLEDEVSGRRLGHARGALIRNATSAFIKETSERSLAPPTP